MAKKILYIGHYREGTGWSRAAIDYILALDAAGVDVVCRPVKLNDKQPELPQRILELEQKSSKNSTHCIQHVLPHYMDYNGKMHNIGLFVTETDSIAWTGWPSRLKTMDEIWVPNSEMLEMCNKEVGVNTRVVPHACDVSKYDKEYPSFDLSIMEDRHLFYFVGEFNRRKRISALIQAYNLAFDRNDNVGLVIKVNKPGMSDEELFHQMSETDRIVKEKLRLYPNDSYYPPVYFITSRLTDDQMGGLHQRCNTFVTLSFGEAWCIPAFDALGYGNNVISSNCGGMRDFLSGAKGCYRVKGTWEPVFGADMILGDLNTGRENWFSVDTNCAIDCMRNSYLDKPDLSRPNKDIVNKYSYKNIGDYMDSILK